MVDKIRQVFHSKEFIIAVLFFISLIVAAFVGGLWPTTNFGGECVEVYYLDNYEKQVADGEFCFDHYFEFKGLEKFDKTVIVYVNSEENGVFKKNIKLFAENEGNVFNESKIINHSETFCIESSNLEEGNNRIIVKGEETLFFNIEKVDSLEPFDYSLELIDINKSGIMFTFSSNRVRFYPIEIYVNGVFDHKVYPSSKEQTFLEKIEFENGINEVKIKYESTEQFAKINYSEPVKMPVVIGLAIVMICMLVFMLLVFFSEDLVSKFTLSISAIIFILVSLGFILNILNMLSLANFVGVFVFVAVAFAWFFRENLSKIKTVKKKDVLKSLKKNLSNPIILLIIIGAIIIPLTLNLFMVTGYSYWNTYYERQGHTLAEEFTLPLVDELSFLGRPLGYTPGYFFFEAGMIWMTGLTEEIIFALILLFANIFLLFSVIMFGKSLGFDKNRAAIIYIFLWTSSFIQGFIFLSPRHSLTLGLFFVALALILTKRKEIFSGLILGVMAFIQFPLFVAYPVLYAILSKEHDWKRLVKTMLIGSFIFLIFFLPNIINFGFLTQAQQTSWGYLINHGVGEIFVDIGIIIGFFLFFTLVDLIKKPKRFDFYKKRLLVAVLIGFIIQMFVSFRWNVFNTIIFVVLLVEAFPKKALKSKYFIRLFAIVFFAFGFMAAQSMVFLPLSSSHIEAYDYLSNHTSSEENILIDPLHGHSITFFTERKVLADLAVEYAPEEKIIDSFTFLEEKDYSILDKYDISWTFNESYFINEHAMERKVLDSEVEFEELDKVFTNGAMNIHWVPKSE